MSSYLVIALLALCLGYFLGRYAGWQEGMDEGKAYAPLELRVTALRTGTCPLCETEFAINDPDCEEIDT